MKNLIVLIMLFISLLLLQGCINKKSKYNTQLGGSDINSIVIKKPALYPEGIDYNPITDKFVVGSFREGAVYEVDLDGNAKKIIYDNRLNSVLSVRVDVQRNRLLVVNSDIGNSVRSYPKGENKLAALAIYNLTSGENIEYVDLGMLLPNSNHLANGMTIDSEGNAYITDSFASVIYKVDIKGNASVFSQSKKFFGEGISLNGIVFHPDGYLIVVKKEDGQLFKVSLDDPSTVTTIATNKKFIGGDGLVLTNKNELLVIANRASGQITETAFLIGSRDNWESANLIDQYKFGKVYLTTGVIRRNQLYVMHSNLKALMLASNEEKKLLNKKATIQHIGFLKNE
jgi:sugar lactone lactonase YvrE